MTKAQKKIAEQLVNGRAAIPYNADTMRSIRAMFKAGKIHYTWCGSWVGVSTLSQEDAIAAWDNRPRLCH